jgi:simple sugar transport system ATP-binding protein
LVRLRDEGKAVLLVSLELDEVMSLPDRIMVMYEGELVANVRPENVTENELGLYMSGSKRGDL